jgi:hypothetical protein
MTHSAQTQLSACVLVTSFAGSILNKHHIHSLLTTRCKVPGTEDWRASPGTQKVCRHVQEWAIFHVVADGEQLGCGAAASPSRLTVHVPLAALPSPMASHVTLRIPKACSFTSKPHAAGPAATGR